MQQRARRQLIVVELDGLVLFRHVAEIAGRRAAEEVREVPDDAVLAVAPGLGIGLGDVDPARHVDLAMGGVGGQARRRLAAVAPVEGDLAAERLERRQRGQHQAEAVARGVGHRALGAGGHEQRRMRLLTAHRKDLELALDARAEVRALVRHPPLVEQREDELDGFFLHVAAALEVAPEAVELVRPVAGAEPEHHAPVREQVDEGHVLDHAHGVVQRQRHHRGAEADARGARGEIAEVREDVGHDAVLVREVMLGHPRGVVAERVGGLDLAVTRSWTAWCG
jgi:hypothetical protein